MPTKKNVEKALSDNFKNYTEQSPISTYFENYEASYKDNLNIKRLSKWTKQIQINNMDESVKNVFDLIKEFYNKKGSHEHIQRSIYGSLLEINLKYKDDIYSSIFNDYENILKHDQDYRDHIFHMLHVYLIGCHIIDNFYDFFKDYCNKNLYYQNIEFSWFIVALFHDMAMPIQRFNKSISTLLTNFLFSNISPVFYINPKDLYLKEYNLYFNRLITLFINSVYKNENIDLYNAENCAKLYGKFYEEFINFNHAIWSSLMVNKLLSYSFCWENVPGKDESRLREFLIRNFNADWVNNEKDVNIKSYPDEKRTIKVIDGSEIYNIITLNLIDDKLKIKFTTGEFYEFPVRKENGKNNIYQLQECKKERRDCQKILRTQDILSLAICMHDYKIWKNFKNKEIIFESQPLTFLLILCDNLHETDRLNEKFGKHDEIEMKIIKTKNPKKIKFKLIYRDIESVKRKYYFLKNVINLLSSENFEFIIDLSDKEGNYFNTLTTKKSYPITNEDKKLYGSS